MTSTERSRIVGFAFLAAAPALLSALAGGGVGPWSAVGAALVLAGLAVARMARGRWVTAPFAMLLLSTAGMALGLTIDRQWAGPQSLATLCNTGSEPFSAVIVRHWELLRGTNIAMVLGGLATIPVIERRAWRLPNGHCRQAVCARTGFNILCNLTMLAGMLLGAWVGPAIATVLRLDWGIQAMMTAMMSGMVWGMVAVVALARTGWALLDRRTMWTAQPL